MIKVGFFFFAVVSFLKLVSFVLLVLKMAGSHIFSTFTYQLLFSCLSVLILFIFRDVIPQPLLLGIKSFLHPASYNYPNKLGLLSNISNIIVNDSPIGNRLFDSSGLRIRYHLLSRESFTHAYT